MMRKDSQPQDHRTRQWVAPRLEKLGTMQDVAASGAGTGETNPGGQIKFLAS